MTDPEDLLSESLQTLYDYSPVAYSSAGSSFTYTYYGPLLLHPPSSDIRPGPPTDRSLTIILKTPDTQPANWSLHASSVWMASIFVADHLQDLFLDRRIRAARDDRRTLRVLELGAGAGLPGILIAKCYDDIEVISSDYPDESLIEALEDNIVQNRVSDRCRAVPYAWGTDPAPLLTTPKIPDSRQSHEFDVIIAADTLWNPDLHSIFLKTLCMTLRKSLNARIYLVAGLHTGRYAIQAFLRDIVDAGLKIEELLEKEANGSDQRDWCAERAGETEQDRRRWVIWVVLRWV
ncbi:uncharacterized protein FIBRA_04638 [Fibroporia radiculosa]|uniref:Elongation factor methyltransferase 7 n=1 Tax=Fibroporia radiculosa TaxID=599839 RepID=J4IA98_9APHY|nr:uncharacterized protein FIBRA_04638 [Fibroporia radiculosa]CCM02536.1 predicted protein [Fibroporia radiculosa]